MAVTDIKSALVNESPIDPNTKPANKRAKYGRLANTPACAILNPKTFGDEKKKIREKALIFNLNEYIFLRCFKLNYLTEIKHK